MIESALSFVVPLALPAALAKEPAIPVVVITGLVLVFFILFLLTLILRAEGSLFAALDKKGKKAEAEKPQPAQAAPQAAPVPAAQPAPIVEEGIPAEVVAAIAAAVSELEGGRYTLRSVSTSPRGRNQWGLAGVISYTEPF